jgi:putative transposase
MGYRRVSLAQNEYFHIYNRGVDKRVIFKDDIDRVRFVQLLFLCNSREPVNIRNLRRDISSIYEYDRGENLVALGAYCLMPNHFHILLTPLMVSGVETFMRKLLTGYSMYFNKRYERTGILFQGRFKSEHVDSDEYLKYLFAYIHLNPVKLIQSDWKEVGIRDKERAREYCEGYRYSSLQDYLGIQRGESAILDRSAFPEYFPTESEVERTVFSWFEDPENKQARPV